MDNRAIILRDRVHCAIEANPHVCRRNVRFQTNEGRVVLQGEVASYYEKQMAQESIRKVEGVTQIDNELEVIWS